MKSTVILFASALAIVFVLGSCKKSLGENDITVNDFIAALKNDSSSVVLDIRNPNELTGSLGKIEGAVNIPIGDLEDRITELTLFKSNLIFVICRSGNRSRSATRLLLEHGFNAKNVWGGMKEYREFVK